MKKVASLKYGVVFKKAFCDPEIFSAFSQDMIGRPVSIDHVETEKEFDPPIGLLLISSMPEQTIIMIASSITTVQLCWSRWPVLKITVRRCPYLPLLSLHQATAISAILR
ncbi:MAG: hypothetical protein QTN59_00435 [Candidatus Electrothrix communis]|nr:MAG: hypothetical protein QTN59_00435 [Candidatus Electrothrix communis]